VKEFVGNHKVLVTVAAILIAALVAAAVAWWILYREDGPIEVTSAWPVATTERVVAKPAPPAIWPLTGMPAEQGDDIDRRPVAVKIENSSASRPQSALNSADVVYESVTEGGITRFNAIYHTDLEGVVGNIRSARLSEAKIVPQYDALLVFSGSSGTVLGAMRAAGVDTLSEDEGVTSFFFRSNQRRSPHNLYAELEGVLPEAKRRGMEITGAPRSFQFSSGSNGSSLTVNAVDIPFSDRNRATWTYDSGSGTYLRETNGSVHRDAETGDQVSADNVVVMWSQYTPASRDTAGSVTYNIELVGEGRATVFRDGLRYDGTWIADASNPPRFIDENGVPIRLATGRTWFQVVPSDVNITME
jgi:hypothetical protein